MNFDLSIIGSGLPVASALEELTQLGEQAVVIQAPPGTGKTTLIPPFMANQCGGKVIVTTPRRVAVRAAAHRLAQLDGSVIGDRVGYSIRGDHHPGALVEFVTPGVLVRRLLRDPELLGVSAVVVDEVHERQLDTDLALGMVAELQQLRDDLQVVAMSATIDAPRFAKLLQAPVVTVSAETHPVDIDYLSIPGRAECSPDFLAEVARLSVEKLGMDSALVFLPGVREVTRCCAELEKCTDIPVFPLHGGLDSVAQDAALRFGGQRIVVSTNIAESSVTVPGVRLVVDAGLARVPKRDAARGMNGLVTTSCSKSSAEQRAGRAGREGPGRVIRCYSASDFARFAPHIAPEIASADLTQFALFLRCWGSSISDFPLLDTPPSTALDDALRALHSIGALENDRITPLGEKIALIPAEPRLAKALLTLGAAAAPTIAALSENLTGDLEQVIQQLRGTKRFDAQIARFARLVPTGQSCSVGQVVGTAFPDLIARKEGDGYLLAQGTRAQLSPQCRVAAAQWLAIGNISLSGSKAIIHSAAAIEAETAVALIGTTKEVTVTVSGTEVKGRKVQRAGAIVLMETPVVVTTAQAETAILASVQQQGLGFFQFSPKAQALKERLHILHKYYGPPWPDVDSIPVSDWLYPEIGAIAAGNSVDMYDALQRILPWPEAARLAELAPEAILVPSGRMIPVDYAGQVPTVKVKLQECFGLAESPVICGYRVVFHLLSPAGRPLAVTDDLSSFWAGPYAGVRADMRGRYPKHPWPEDPTTAVATAKTKKRM